jgi:lysozyme family protein
VNFDIAFDRLMGSEGGYVNDPQDPGGETQWGISKRSYPNLDIKAITRDQAKEIYRSDFWNRIHADELADGVAFQAFDFAVNSGIETAVRCLQRAVGAAPDGHWGPETRDKATKMSETDTIMRFVAERLDFWRSLSTWYAYGRGWAGRAAQDLRYGAQDS